jgi:hypothetical protein
VIERLARPVLIALILAGGGAVAWAAAGPLMSAGALPSAQATDGSGRVTATARPADSLIAAAIRRPMFRPGRRPAAVRFDPGRVEGPSDQAPASPPRPSLTVSGIVWGAEPAALLEGLPGSEGSVVVRKGERVAGIRVVRIERDRVVLAGLDTNWNLGVREPWP